MLLLLPCPAIFFCCDRRSSPFRRFPQITFSDISDFLPSRWRTISPLTYSIKDPCGTHRQAFYFCARMMPVAIARRRQHSTKKGEGKIRKLGNPLCAHKERPPPPPQLRGGRLFYPLRINNRRQRLHTEGGNCEGGSPAASSLRPADAAAAERDLRLIGVKNGWSGGGPIK